MWWGPWGVVRGLGVWWGAGWGYCPISGTWLLRREAQRPEDPAAQSPSTMGPGSQDACWAVRPNLGHPAHQLNKGVTCLGQRAQ